MTKSIKRIMVTIAAAAGLLLPMTVPVIASAQANATNAVKCGANIDVGSVGSGPTNCSVGGTEEKVNNVVKLAINLFSVIVGLISVFMIIVGGLKYITSGGESSNVTGAKNTIMYAVIGLVVVAIAQFIVKFVLQKASDATA